VLFSKDGPSGFSLKCIANHEPTTAHFDGMKFKPSWTPKILVLSLALNLVFAFFASAVIIKKGGVAPLAKTLLSIFQTKSSSRNHHPRLSYPPSYHYHKSIYESLPDEANEIIFLGDSITDNGEWSELFKNLKIKNRGIQGDRTDGILKRLSEVLSSSPQKIFLMIGYNDLSRGVEIDAIVANYEKIIQTIKTRSPGTQIYIQSVLPINTSYYKGRVKNRDVIQLNRHLRQLSNKYNSVYIDLYSSFCDDDRQLNIHFAGKDGLHLNGKGYLKWKSILEDFVYN
jgi:lysophospholipase L1-like esterase